MKTYYTLAKLLLGFSILLSARSASAQTNTFPSSGAVGIGTTTPNASSLLEVSSTTRGILLPRMTKTQRDAITSPPQGLLIYQTNSTPGLYYYEGSWKGLGKGGANVSLGNLKAPTAVNVDLLPNADNTLDLGSPSLGWRNVYAASSYYIGINKVLDITGGENTFVGKTGTSANTGTNNTLIGFSAGFLNIAAGCHNTAIGSVSLYSNITGSYNTAVGEEADVNDDNYSNSSAFGYNSLITADNQVRIGNSSVSVIEGQVAYSYPSDGRFKFNVNEDVKGLEFINKLRPVTYQFDTKKFDDFLMKNMPAGLREKRMKDQNYTLSTAVVHNGFIAQEVEADAKECGFKFDGVHAPANDNDNYSIAYSQFVVPLVKAVQELSAKNDAKDETIKSLQLAVGTLSEGLLAEQNENEEMKNQIAQLQSAMSGSFAKLQTSNAQLQMPLLGQNIPNPFDNSTLIPFRVPKDCSDASIVISESATGRIVRIVPVSCNETQLALEAGTLTSGSYSYSLYADGKMIETKRMELLK